MLEVFKRLCNECRNLNGFGPYLLLLDLLFLRNRLPSSQLFAIQFLVFGVIKSCCCYRLRVYIPGAQTWHLFHNVCLHSTDHGVG